MEKKSILAVALSILVLLAWSAFFPPQRAKHPMNISEHNEIKEVTDDSADHGLSAAPALLADPSPVEAFREFVVQAESDILLAQFSNTGGTLKQLTIKEFNHTLPVENFLNIKGYENKKFTILESAANFVAYVFEDRDVKIIKRYHLSRNDYSVTADIEVTNKTKMSKLISLESNSFDINLDIVDNKKLNGRDQLNNEYSFLYNGTIERKRGVSKFSPKENKKVQGSIRWTGFRDQYFCTIVKPVFPVSEYYVNVQNEKQASFGVRSEPTRLPAGSKSGFKAFIYYGPQDAQILKEYGEGLEKIINFNVGGFFDIMALGMTDTIAKWLFVLLSFIHKIIPNWGVAIILFAFAIFGLTFPLTHKSMKSMRKMQAIQPKMAKIREKHKDNPQKLNQEVASLFKEHKVNPLGGCLPMLLQMPIFVSLYQLLWRSYSLKGASFLWIKDLTESDKLFILPFNLPFFGNEFNILPIFYGVLMFLQQSFSSKSMPVADPQQAAQQKMMSRIFPVLLAVIFYKFASGVTLYFCTYFLLSALSQWKIAKMTKAAS